MYVTSPQYYLKLVSHEAVFLPLWLSERSIAVEIPNRWEERRLPGNDFSSIFHATLPASYIKEPDEPGSFTVQEPRWWSDSRGLIDGTEMLTTSKNSWDIIKRIEKNIVHGFPCYVIYTIRYMSNYFSDLTRGRIRVSVSDTRAYRGGDCNQQHTFGQALNIKPVDRLVVDEAAPSNKMSPNDIWACVETRIEKPVFESWDHATDGWKQLFTTSAKWDKDALVKWCNSIVESAFKYAEESNVKSHAHVTHRRNPLNPKEILEDYEADRGQPTWFALNEEVQAGKAKAYVDALEDLRTLSMNTLQNLASLYSLMTHFLFDAETTTDVVSELIKQAGGKRYMRQMHALDLPSIPSYPKDAWLGGRYIWCTSVSDANQGFEYVMHKIWQQMRVISQEMKCHGTATVGDTAFSCTFVTRERALTSLNRFIEKGYELGLEPNAYVMWDFVPFSFVCDWFIPIGDSLDAYTKASHYCPLYYDYINHFGPYSLCYSLKYKVKTVVGYIEVYHRWYEANPPEVDTSYFVLGKESASSKIACWRFVDALCLVL